MTELSTQGYFSHTENGCAPPVRLAWSTSYPGGRLEGFAIAAGKAAVVTKDRVALVCLDTGDLETLDMGPQQLLRAPFGAGNFFCLSVRGAEGEKTIVVDVSSATSKVAQGVLGFPKAVRQTGSSVVVYASRATLNLETGERTALPKVHSLQGNIVGQCHYGAVRFNAGELDTRGILDLDSGAFEPRSKLHGLVHDGPNERVWSYLADTGKRSHRILLCEDTENEREKWRYGPTPAPETISHHGVLAFCSSDSFVALDVFTGEELYKQYSENTGVCFAGDFVWMVRHSGKIECTSLRTGESVWQGPKAPGSCLRYSPAHKLLIAFGSRSIRAYQA